MKLFGGLLMGVGGLLIAVGGLAATGLSLYFFYAGILEVIDGRVFEGLVYVLYVAGAVGVVGFIPGMIGALFCSIGQEMWEESGLTEKELAAREHAKSLASAMRTAPTTTFDPRGSG